MNFGEDLKKKNLCGWGRFDADRCVVLGCMSFKFLLNVCV